MSFARPWGNSLPREMGPTQTKIVTLSFMNLFKKMSVFTKLNRFSSVSW